MAEMNFMPARIVEGIISLFINLLYLFWPERMSRTNCPYKPWQICDYDHPWPAWLQWDLIARC